jgi:hypothetical protein
MELEGLNIKEIFPFFTTYHFIKFHWIHLHFTTGTLLLYLKTDRGTQHMLRPSATRKATDTKPLSEKRPRDATINPPLPAQCFYVA